MDYTYESKVEFKQWLSDISISSVKFLKLKNSNHQGWDSQNFLGEILKIFVALSFETLWFFAVETFFKADIIMDLYW